MTENDPIILIDDDDDECELMETALRKEGIQNPLHCFSTGQEALDYLGTTTESPFLILCDINMPKMDGIAVRKQINETDYLRKKSIPFVFYTTSATSFAVDQAYDMCVQGFFVKGFDMDKIGRLVKCIYSYWAECRHPNQY